MIPFLILLLFVFLFPSCITKAPLSMSLPNTYSKIEVAKKHYSPDETTSIYYPQLVGLEDEQIQEQVNNELKKCCDVLEINVQNAHEDSESSEDFEIIMHKTGDCDFQVFNNVVMIKVYTHYWEDGAAGGYSFITTLCIDGKTGEFYKFKDLLKSEKSLIALQALLQSKLAQEQENYSFIVDEIPALKPDQSFYLTKEGIEVIFEPYEITRGFNVFPSFLVTWQEMDEITNKDSHFFKSIQMI